MPPESALAASPDVASSNPLKTNLPVSNIAPDTWGSPRNDVHAPRARLRSESPRPIGNEPRSPATIRRAPPPECGIQNASLDENAYRPSTPWSPPTLLPVGFTGDSSAPTSIVAAPPTSAAPSAIPASDGPSNVADSRELAPPPWPSNPAHEEPRTHIVVDGDSLEKLAGRYLDDPRRSSEIFDLNRGELSSPDLLPIGAELRIPERASRTSWDRQSRWNGWPNDIPVREAANGNLVPVRRAASEEIIIPRAQLATPQPVE
jgi:nucleoid-associated protein YgaU